MKTITYRCGYRYQLISDYTVQISIKPEQEVSNRFFKLECDGTLTIRADYSWDGPSGPSIDTKDFMRGSLVHDVCYQMMREGLLDSGKYRSQADDILREICIEDGMPYWRASYVWMAVRFGGGKSVQSGGEHEVITAP